jgi:hypothetical protein
MKARIAGMKTAESRTMLLSFTLASCDTFWRKIGAAIRRKLPPNFGSASS